MIAIMTFFCLRKYQGGWKRWGDNLTPFNPTLYSCSILADETKKHKQQQKNLKTLFSSREGVSLKDPLHMPLPFLKNHFPTVEVLSKLGNSGLKELSWWLHEYLCFSPFLPFPFLHSLSLFLRYLLFLVISLSFPMFFVLFLFLFLTSSCTLFCLLSQ